MQVNNIFKIAWEEGGRGNFYEDSTLLKSISRCALLFPIYDIKSRLFAEVLKTYLCIFFIYLKISLYVFELLLEILENLKYFNMLFWYFIFTLLW